MSNRRYPAVAALALATLVLCVAAPQGRAQVVVNPRALDPLLPPGHPAAPAAAAPTPPKPARPAPARSAAVPRPPANLDGPHQKLPPLNRPPAGTATAAGKPGAPAIPAAPPPAPVLPPPIMVPVRPAPPPPPTPVAADAPGTYSKLPGGLRVTFGEGRTDLNPDTLAALHTLAHSAPPDSNTTFSVTGYSAGTADDPSTARRLSLSRALTVRSALMAEGVPSVRIYVKALGTPPAAAAPPADRAPADRTDIILQASTPAAPAPVIAPAPAPAAAPSPAAANQKAAP